MSSPKAPERHVDLAPFNPDNDVSSVFQVWNAALPNYPIPLETLGKLLLQENARHVIAKEGSKIIGFCLAYVNRHPGNVGPSGYIAVLAVHPDVQKTSIGSVLLRRTIQWFNENIQSCRLELGSSFPRFWPGVPVPLTGVDEEDVPGPSPLTFFLHRGFEMRPDPPRSIDLYRDIRDFTLDERGKDYTARAREAGYTFSPLQKDGHEECMAGQTKNFADNPAWVDMYANLNPTSHPSSIMAAFSPTGTQIGWTLMLSHTSSIMHENWAMPAVCGPKTGLIGCVGIDEAHRGSGVGIALVAHAMQDMRRRGVESVFVDWVALEGFYERLGFDVWGRYRVGGIGGSMEWSFSTRFR